MQRKPSRHHVLSWAFIIMGIRMKHWKWLSLRTIEGYAHFVRRASSPISRRVLLECIDMPHPHTLSDAPSDTLSDQWRISSLLCLVRSTKNNSIVNKNEMEWFMYRAREEFPVRVAKNEVEQFASTNDDTAASRSKYMCRLLRSIYRVRVV
jgi:hypothetical protein